MGSQKRRSWVVSGWAFWLLWVAGVPTAVAVTTARHSVWRVEFGTNTLYLVGAIHVLKPEDYPLPDVMEQAFRHSSVVVFETDLGALERPSTQQQLLDKGQLPGNKTLSQVLPPDLYTNFSRYLLTAGLPEETFERLKPAMAAMALEVQALEKLGYDFQFGLDRHFFELAQQSGKIIVPLETVEFQTELITDMPKPQGEQLLTATLADAENTATTATGMLRAWQTGNAGELARLLNAGLRHSPELEKRLVTDRNRRWLPKLIGLLRGGKTAVVIVGAGHLVGSGGLVALLRDKGYRVVQE